MRDRDPVHRNVQVTLLSCQFALPQAPCFELLNELATVYSAHNGGAATASHSLTGATIALSYPDVSQPGMFGFTGTGTCS
jgi:hypothetical protein